MQASRDQNNTPTLIAVANTDGDTLIKVKANPVSGRLLVDIGSGGTDQGPTEPIEPRDENYVPGLMAVSSEDGETPVVVYATAEGRLLIDNN